MVIASITLYFRRTETIMTRMARDRISTFSRELLKLNRDIEAIVAQRTETEMSLFMAHEVRNPAMIIAGMARKIKKSSPENGVGKNYIDAILTETAKLESLIQDLGKSQPPGQKEFASVDLNEILATALMPMGQEAQAKEVALVTEYHPSPLIFLGSKHLMTIVIIHVMRNAIGACKGGDRIEVMTRPAEK